MKSSIRKLNLKESLVSNQNSNNSTNMRSSYKSDEETKKLSNSKSQIKKKEPKLTEKEIQDNRIILKNMQRKLNFVKNPRFRTTRKCLLYENAEFKDIYDKENPFAVDPPLIMFRDYQIGSTYNASLFIINRTQLLKNFKYIAPSTPFFSISKITYPKKDSSLIAPGMRAKIDISFKPDSLESFNDYVKIISEFYAFQIPLKAIRETAALTIENPMNCNKCLVGEQVSMIFRCRNNGGDAHFKIEAADFLKIKKESNILNDSNFEEESNNNKSENKSNNELKEKEEVLNQSEMETETLEVEPFSIFPREFYLIKNMPIEIFVNFHPTRAGDFERKVNIVCDSKTTFPQTIIGEGIMTDLYVSEYDGLQLHPPPTQVFDNEERLDNDSSQDALENINFQPTFPLSTSQKTIKIKNTSCVCVNYHWSIYDFYPENKIKLSSTENFFSISPSKGVIEANGEGEFTLTFSPNSAKIYENKIDFIIEDIPFQAIKKLNKTYIREKNLNSSKRDSLLDIPKYGDPFLLGFHSPLPYYPLFTFKLKGLGKLNELTLNKEIINLGDIYLGKKYTEKFNVINKLSGIVLFKMKKQYQFYSKKNNVNNYFKNFYNNKEATLKFGPFYDKHFMSLQDQIESGENNSEEVVMTKHNMMEHILSLVDEKLKFESDYIECEDLYLTTNNGFYKKKIDFSTLKKAKIKKRKNFIPPRIRLKERNDKTSLENLKLGNNKSEIYSNSNNLDNNDISLNKNASNISNASSNKKNTTKAFKLSSIENRSKLENKNKKTELSDSLINLNKNNTSVNRKRKETVISNLSKNEYLSASETKLLLQAKKNNLTTNTRLDTNNAEGLTYSSTRLSRIQVNPNQQITENMIYMADYDQKEGVEFIIHFLPTKLGKFKATIIFTAQDCQPISIDIHANILGPEINILKPAIIFPLSAVSTIQEESFVIRNTSEIEAVILVKEQRYTGIGFDNYLQYQETNKGKVTEVEYRRQINNMKNFMLQNNWKIDNSIIDGYRLMLSDVFMILKPGEEKEITVTFTTAYPIKYEDLIEINVLNGVSKFVRVKANCQLADCYIDQTLIAPEEIFISTPIFYKDNSFRMINPSNLPVNFDWQTTDDPEEKQILFYPRKGVIQPNSEVVIKYQIIFHTIKEIDELIICNLPQLDIPLGIEIKGNVRGLNITYEIADETLANMMVRDTISVVSYVSNSNSINTPSVSGVKFKSRKQREGLDIDKTARRFDFKLGVNRYTSQSFLIKNKSGIQTKYKLSLLNYPPQEGSIEEFSETGRIVEGLTVPGMNSSMISKLRNDTTMNSLNNTSVSRHSRFSKIKINLPPLLSDKHEQENFTSEKGKEFSLKKQIEKEAEVYLQNKKGISIVVSPLKGILEPFTDKLITISVYNERVGDFEDELTCEVKGLAEKMVFPITVQIRGNPIQISPFQPGIDYYSVPPIVKCGSVLMNYGQIEKNFKILNTGNNMITLNWNIYDYDDIIKPKNRDIINLSIICTETKKEKREIGKYKFNFEALKPKTFKDKYYFLSPLSRSLLPKNTADFNVKFSTDKEGIKSALLVAHLNFEEDTISAVKMSDLAVKIDSFGIRPHLTVNKLPSLDGDITYKFYYNSSGENTKHRRSIILINKEKIEFKTQLIIEGPFVITNTHPKEASITESIFSIMPNTSLKVDIRFIPPKLNEADWPMLLQNEKFGKLTTVFENNIKEEYLLKGILKRPRLALSFSGNEIVIKDELIDFGYVNIESHDNSQFYLLNETDVGTDWDLTYVSFKKKTVYGYGTTTIEENEDIQMTDDPSVFNFNKVEGFIEGPSNILNNMPLGPGLFKRDDYKSEQYAPILIKVVFKPKNNVFYKSRFRIRTKTGNNIDFVLKGYGSLKEEDIKTILLKTPKDELLREEEERKKKEEDEILKQELIKKEEEEKKLKEEQEKNKKTNTKVKKK